MVIRKPNANPLAGGDIDDDSEAIFIKSAKKGPVTS